MARPSAHDRVLAALDALPAKPQDSERSEKKGYSEAMSHALAGAIAQSFADVGLPDMRPRQDEAGATAGQERRMSGGIGAKKVDVTCSSAEAGLLLAGSIKTVNWRDGRSGTFQKNLTNRRGDLLFESVTLHRRFPYAVLVGFFFLDHAAREDGSARRSSTFANAHHRLALFTGRRDPGGRDEQYERLYVGLVRASPAGSAVELFEAGRPEAALSVDEIVAEVAQLVALRNADFFEWRGGRLTGV